MKIKLENLVEGLCSVQKMKTELETQEKKLKKQILEHEDFDDIEFSLDYADKVTLRVQYPASEEMPWEAIENLGLSDEELETVSEKMTIELASMFEDADLWVKVNSLLCSGVLKLIIDHKAIKDSPIEVKAEFYDFVDTYQEEDMFYAALPGNIHAKINPDLKPQMILAKKAKKKVELPKLVKNIVAKNEVEQSA